MEVSSIVILAVSMAALAFASRYVIKYVEDLIEMTSLGETSAGFAILSVITSTPEFIVAIFAILEGTPTLSVGDLLGSNVFNIGVVVGILMLTAGFLKECPEGLDEIADVLLLSSIIPLVLVILRAPTALLGLGLIAVFFFSVFKETKVRSLAPIERQSDKSRRDLFIILLKILIITSIVILSARFVVSSALEITTAISISPLLLGALIVAFGTSLPELNLSITAAKRGRMLLASANAIGSNLTNLSLILGIVFISSLFSPFTVDVMAFSETISFVLITSLIVWYHMTKGGDCRLTGIALILTYVIFQLTTILG